MTFTSPNLSGYSIILIFGNGWLNANPGAFQPFLEEEPAPDERSWVDKYFDNPEFLSFKRKMVFKNMVL